MKVQYQKDEVSCYVGDIVLCDDIACMVIYIPNTEEYGLLQLEGTKAGYLIKSTDDLYNLDVTCSRILIQGKDVFIKEVRQ